MATSSSLSRCPIEDVLPWISSSTSTTATTQTTTLAGNTVLVADRVETTGRFLLFVTAAAALSQKRQRVLWLSFSGAYTIDSMKQGLKKLGCLVTSAAPTTASFLFVDSTQRLTIRAVAQEMAQGLISQGSSNEFNAKSFVRNLYLHVQEWLQQNQGGNDEASLVLLDDVSALADLVGPSLAYALVYQVTARIRGQTRLLIRCAGDAFDDTTTTTTSTTTTTDEQTWIGAGAAGSNMSMGRKNSACWEASLVELAGWVVDVLPLQSGYSREAHGRLLLTPRSSSSSSNTSPMCCNYCLTDQAVFAIRLTTKTLG